MPRGGARPGAGRKPKDWRPADVLQYPQQLPTVPAAKALPSVEEFEAPGSLSEDERRVWLQQAPFAFKNRTLTRASAFAFERYCRVVVLEANEAKSSGMGGANHRGLLSQINKYELQFALVPNGRPMPVVPEDAPAEAPASVLAGFRR